MVNRKRESVALSYIHGGNIRHCFHESVVKLVIFDMSHEHLLSDTLYAQGLYIHSNRNEVVRQFLQTEAEWLLSIDTDIEFDPMDVYNLIGTAIHKNVKILSGLYFGYVQGYPKLLPMWLKKVKEGLYQMVQTIVPGINELGAIGMGFCVIHRSVLEEMAKVYGDRCSVWFDHDPGQRADGTPEPMGEDVSFCDRAAAIGIKTYGYSAIVVKHEKMGKKSLEDFMKDHSEAAVAKEKIEDAA